MPFDKWIWGCVNSDGTIHSGSGFTVTRKDLGIFEITYTSKFEGPPAVVLTQNFPEWNNFDSGGGDARDNSVLIASDHRHCKIKTGGADGGPSDRNFTFIAMGPM